MLDALPKLRVTELRVSNYRSLKDVVVDLSNSMTVLIGKNAAGKSTIIDAFEFVTDGIKDIKASVKKRGGTLKDITWGGSGDLQISLRFKFQVPQQLRKSLIASLGTAVALSAKPQYGPRIETQPKINENELAASHFMKHLEYSLILGGTFLEMIECSGLLPDGPSLILSSIDGLGQVHDRHAEVENIWQLTKQSAGACLLGTRRMIINSSPDHLPNLLSVVAGEGITIRFANEITAQLRAFFQGVYHGSPYRKASLSLAVNDNEVIDPEGSMLVQVLHTLNNNRNKTFRRIEADLHSLVNEVESISTPIVEKNKTTLEFYQSLEGIGDVSFDLSQMSSGTIQMLILLTQLHTCAPNSLLLLEEVEAMLHPSAQAQLLKILIEASDEKTILLSTHSPIIASQANGDSIVLIKKHRGVTSIHPYSETLAQEIIEEMGIRPSFSFESDCVIFVEGEYDEAVYNHWLAKYGISSSDGREVLIDAQGYSKIQFFANARILSRKVVKVAVYAVFDGDTREKGDYKQAVTRLGLGDDQVLELKARNLDSLLSKGEAIKAAFPSIAETSVEIDAEFTAVGDNEDRLKGALKRVLRTVGGYTAKNAVAIAEHLEPPAEWLNFFRRILAKSAKK